MTVLGFSQTIIKKYYFNYWLSIKFVYATEMTIDRDRIARS